MTKYKILFTFYALLNPRRKVEIDTESIIGNSVLDCSRKAFEHKQKLESQRGGEIVYKKTKVEKIKERRIPKSKKIDLEVESSELSAEDAIRFINENDMETIQNGGFISEDEDRVTVLRALNNKK